MLILSLSKIFVVLILIQNVTSQSLYKSKRDRPSYKELSRARSMRNKEKSTTVSTTLVDPQTDQENTSTNEPEVIEQENPTVDNNVLKLKSPAIYLEAPPPPEPESVTKNRRKILVQKRRLNSEIKSDVSTNIAFESTTLPIEHETAIPTKEVVVTEAIEYQVTNEPTTTTTTTTTTEGVTTRKVTPPILSRRKSVYSTETPTALKSRVTQAVGRARNSEYSTTPRTTYASRTKDRTNSADYVQYSTTPTTTFARRTEDRTNSANYVQYSTKPTTTFAKRTEDTTDNANFIPIVGLENYVYAYSGDYHYSYEGGDGTKAFERGESKTIDNKSQSDVVGGYSYKDKDGNEVSLSYTAGKDGYRPVGAHLPTPPPIPPAILRVLRILATKTTPEPVTESM